MRPDIWISHYHITKIEFHDIRYWVKCFYSRWVRASYGVASAYVLADTADKGQKMNKVSRLAPA